MKSLRFGILLLLIVAFAYGVQSQTKTRDDESISVGRKQKASLKNFIKRLQPAFYNRDYETLAAEMFRNKESDSADGDFDEERNKQVLAIIKHLFETTAADGIKFIVRLKSPQEIVAADQKLFAVVPQITIITVSDTNNARQPDGSAVKPGKYIAKSYILAISNDQGNTWKYWSAFSEASYKNSFPGLTGKIKFPAVTTPSFLNIR